MTQCRVWIVGITCALLATRLAAAQTAPTADTPRKSDAAAKSEPAPSHPAADHPRPKSASKKTDYLALGTTTVTGNKELPKVMYIVPWKQSDLGDLGGRPVNSLLDDVLAPVDREVFRRQVDYYQALSTASPQKPATASPP